MKKLAAALAIALALAQSAFSHTLDEYLQATLISLQKDRIDVSLRLTPGVAVFAEVFGGIDTDADRIISKTEQWDYAERVLGETSLSVDGNRLKPRLLSVDFPTVEQLKQGLGQIQIAFTADSPVGSSRRSLVFENHHQGRISAYLVNCLVPQDPHIRVIAQHRTDNQSSYQLDYMQSAADSALAAGSPTVRTWLDNFDAVPSMIRLGMRHIAEGTDHLLFLLVLLLPAPLRALRSRWIGFASARESLLQILRVVTAFTVGHSITLAFGALGVVSVPSGAVEMLIAISILVSAVHALRPVFPGREALLAGSFGLIHGLAFATSLGKLGLDPWQRGAGILGFNLGIEIMQVAVVAATMPSLILLNRTRAYSLVRIGGGVFAGLASLGWIVGGFVGVQNPMDAVLNSAARHGPWLFGALLLFSLACWALPAIRREPAGRYRTI
jgi:hypothetical protein